MLSVLKKLGLLILASLALCAVIDMFVSLNIHRAVACFVLGLYWTPIYNRLFDVIPEEKPE